jgi:hypothetical protein
MGNIYEWLNDTDQPSYAPTSPPFGPMEENPFVGVFTDQTFDAPHMWNPSIEQPQAYTEAIPIDPSRRTYRDRQLHKSIRTYRRKSRMEAARKKKRDTKKLRSGRTIRI